jgi:cation diffusion facilitator family transporter
MRSLDAGATIHAGPLPDREAGTRQAIRLAAVGLAVNAGLVAVKIGAGLLGNSYALVADGVESATDVVGSLIVLRGLSIASRSADEHFHFGYGRAETLAAATVALMLVAAAVGIAVEAVREIVTPHAGPRAFTLVVLVAVVVVKEWMFRRVLRVSGEVSSRALETDAWHHRSDAITSAAAFVGISLALAGGPGWAPADDWAALFASCIIAFNGIRLLRPAVMDLMDRAPSAALLDQARARAGAVPGVMAVEKLQARRAGLGYLVSIHVQADPLLSLRDAHSLGGRVRSVLRAESFILDAFVHMEPYEAAPGDDGVAPASSSR